MFCKHCGSQMNDNSIFCSNCGKSKDQTPVADSVFLDLDSPTAKKKMKWWQILLIVVGILILLSIGIRIIFPSLFSGNNYRIIQNANVDSPDTSYDFIDGAYFSCYPKFGGNEAYILKFSNITENSIDIEYYSHDLGTGGKDLYYHDYMTRELKYNSEEECYEFDFCGYWKLYSHHLEYNRYEINQSYRQRFETVDPVNPDDFWWFEEAKKLA